MIKSNIQKKLKTIFYTTNLLQGIKVFFPGKVFASDDSSFGKVSHPLVNLRGTETGEGLGNLLNNVITFATYIAGVALLAYLIFGGISWIVAGGNEDQVAKAQKMISNAVIGIVIVVAAIMVTQILGGVLGFENILQPTFPGAGGPAGTPAPTP